VNQQINLYQPMFRRRRTVLSAIAIVQVAVITVLVLAAIHGYTLWQVGALEAELAALEARRDRMAERAAALAARYSPKQKSALLEREIERLRAERDHTRRVVEALAGGTLGDVRGFADYLEALARRHVAGTWLTAGTLAEGGRAMALSGSTLAPDLVALYIRRLGDEPVLSGRAFNVLRLRRDEAEPRRVDFTLGTRAQAEEKG